MNSDVRISRTDWFTALSTLLGIVAVPIIAFLGIVPTISVDGVPGAPSTADIVAFWSVVGVAAVVQLAALVRAIIRRRAWHMVIHSVLVVMITITALLFAIPEL